MNASAKAVPLSFEKSVPGVRSRYLAPLDVPAVDPAKALGPLARTKPPGLPELGELDTVRHFTNLSRRNFGIDTTFYPLGSCTMKYNPRVNEWAAALPGFARIHPAQDPRDVQGMLRMWWELERWLSAVSGFPAVTIQPAAGAQGEYAALCCFKARLKDRGEAAERTQILIPDSAHGTNPSSAVIAGFEPVEIKSTPEGFVDLGLLEKHLGPKTAGLMLTNPNTLGLFERNVRKICEMVHAAGGYVYVDGANTNAILGISRPHDYGADAMHFNLHKTFTTPHGGGGPGAGPIGVSKELAPYLPVPVVVRAKDGTFDLDWDRPKSFGKVHAFLGNAGMVVRAWTYIRAVGGDAMRDVSETAVINANYIRVKLHDRYRVFQDRPCMHEVIFSAVDQAKRGAKASDIAKRLIDFGYHPPTMYFPLIVPECLMVEPTESESKAELDRFIEVMRRIDDEITANPQTLRDAPTLAPVRRVDEVKAARDQVLVWGPALGRPAPSDAPAPEPAGAAP
jgi:glycine dehydrogenase subunit 2